MGKETCASWAMKSYLKAIAVWTQLLFSTHRSTWSPLQLYTILAKILGKLLKKQKESQSSQVENANFPQTTCSFHCFSHGHKQTVQSARSLRSLWLHLRWVRCVVLLILVPAKVTSKSQHSLHLMKCFISQECRRGSSVTHLRNGST